jgi:LysM repeat protein
VTLDQILFVNPEITNANFITAGQVIQIPSADCDAPTSEDPVEPTATCSTGTAITYTVVAGDTFTIIANEKLDITLASFIAANPQVANVDAIEIGQVLNIPLCKTDGAGSSGATTREVYYDCYEGWTEV